VPQKIKIQDLTAPRYKIFISAGLFLFIVAGITWYLNTPPPLYYLSAGLAIACFFAISYDTFTTSNAISIDRYGATFKLLGNKTYGFRFQDVDQVQISDRGLMITFKKEEMEAIKLSQKRYHSQSLKDIYTILTTKIQSL
jgi:hypothetical protein